MSALGKKILDELGDTAIRWLESLGEKYRKMDIGVDTNIENLAGQAGESLSGLEAKAPEFFYKYEKIPLFQAMQEGNLALMKPKTFRQLAARLPDDYYSDIDFVKRNIERFPIDAGVFDEIGRKTQEYADLYESGQLFHEIPYLRFKEQTPTDYQVIGHEGRHRNRALERIGAPQSLVRILPDETYDYLTDRTNYTRGTLDLSDIRANPTFYDELSSFQPKGGAKVGTLGELMEIVNVPSYKHFGALRNLK